MNRRPERSAPLHDRLALEGVIPVTHKPDSSDEYYTPPGLFKALGLVFDLDPATIPGGIPWVPALHTYSWKDDGLAREWQGVVWLNPPYSKPGPWLARLALHGDGMALVKADTSTAWWQRIVATSDAVCFIRHRLRFLDRTGRVRDTAPFPSALVAWGPTAANALEAADLGWTVFQERSPE